ncbi:hypothetical protein EW093_15585 [Thiospirochaeta perfilievii]|uniref:Uncharacterized protein n=1 Tax=Thiospirochaeta perfilievii TaxID=252967 RepID=A0A5C1QFX8_9SPIO|nr:ankyrin repeat domain-containing protein [Thiospirochaeta perfilievii]QEN06050.1 hypothetical protein EW093_15585 [Thiospirochaeta perfilievii]
MSKKGFIFILVNLFLFTSFTNALSQPEVKEGNSNNSKDVETVDEGVVTDSLHALVLSGNESKLNEIFKIDTNINELDKNGRTPLHVACESGNITIAQLLIVQGAKINIQDKQGYTPLHIAIKSGNTQLTKILAKNGADIFIKDNLGRTPYNEAVKMGIESVKALISPESIKSVDSKGMSLLHLAAQAGDYKVCEYLIESEADVNLRDKASLLPLDYALTDKDSLDHAKTAEILIKNRSLNSQNDDFEYIYRVLKTEDLEFRYDFNKTALHIASENGHYGFAALFIEKGVNLELKDRPGNTALHGAVVNNNFKIIELLINSGADIDARDFNNNTPLHLSLAFSYSDQIPSYLIKKGADIDAKDNFGNTPLHLTLSLKLDSSIAKLLINNGADVTVRNKAGNTPLTEAVNKNNKSIALLLLEKDAEIYAKNDKGESPLTLGIKKGEVVLEWLMNNNNINFKNNDGDTPLIIAIREKADSKIIEFLIKKGAKVDTRNKSGSTPLHEAIMVGNSDIINLLNVNKADFFAINNSGDNPFDLIFQKGVEFATEILTPELVSLRNNRQNTPLFYAIDWGSKEIVQVILDKGADINAKNINGETPLHQAITTDNVIVANLLIERGASIEAKDNQLNTPLHSCVYWNAYESAHLLVEKKADINAKNIKNRTPLHEAVLTEDTDIVTFFIKNKSNLNARDNNGQTPLFYAVKNNFPDILNLLLDAGADISLRDRQGNTILHAAVFGKNKDTVKILISKKSDIYAENKYGDTPVSIALTYGLSSVNTFFDDKNINSMDNKGFSPLHLAIKYHADIEVIDYLLDIGANKENINKDGDTPYDLAVKENYEEAEALVK